MTTTPPAACPHHIDTAATDIHAEAELLRAQGPAARVVIPGGIPAWSVTDPALIRRLLASRDISKDAYQHWPAYVAKEIPEDWPLRIWVDVRNALTAYGDEHRRLRRPLANAFSARRVRALTPRIEEITRTLLDELAECGPDEVVDLRARFAWKLPLLVVNVILGVPDELHDGFRDAVGGLFATDDPERAAAAPALVFGLIGQVFEAKKAQPGDDITSALIAAQEAGELSETEVRDSMMLLIGAGHETTVNLIDHALANLLQLPQQKKKAVAGEVPWNDVVEETLRHEAPISTIILRFAVKDVHDAETGLTFAKGDCLVINYAAAGRDPGVHGENAGEFDIARGNHEHLAFGHGAHLCLGAELARIEGRVALEAIFARFPDLALAVDPSELRPMPSFISNGHVTLPVRMGRAVSVPAQAAAQN